MFKYSFDSSPIRYDKKRSNSKKERKKKEEENSSFSSFVDRLVVTTIRRNSPLFSFCIFLFVFLFLLSFPSISLASPLVYREYRSSGQFECLAKFGQARRTRREERTSTRANQATIKRIMMNTWRTGKHKRLLH